MMDLNIKIKKFVGEIENKELTKHYKKNIAKNINKIIKNIDINMQPYVSNLEDIKEAIERIMNDISSSKFDKPDIDPTKKEIKKEGNEIDLVISCREKKRKIETDPSNIYIEPRKLVGNYEECKGKKIIIYVHGYNVDRIIALNEANNLFFKLKKSLKEKGEVLSDYKFILFTWPGDSGLINFDISQRFAEYSGEALYKFFLKLKNESKVEEINLIAHSLGAHVALKSASLIEGNDKNNSYKNVLFLGPAIEEDTLTNNDIKDGYHFPKALGAIEKLNIVTSKADIALEFFFTLNELEKPLGSSRNISDVSSKVTIHDLTPSPLKKNGKKCYVNSHLQYWENQKQVNLYVSFICS